jgi:hypothetical protein
MLACLLLLVLYVGAFGQQPDPDGKRQLFEPPTDKVLLSIASQPKCPIQIESARIFLPTSGSGLSVTYQLRNHGSKPLGVQSVYLRMIGPGLAERGWEDRPKDGATSLIMPGAVMAVDDDLSKSAKIVPATDEILKGLKTPGDRLALAVLVVEEIKFTDGTTYEAKDVTKALRAYFWSLDALQP